MNDKNRLIKIYQKTDGYCHLCHTKLSFKNYNNHGQKGCWNVEHSIPKSSGGTDHLNNLYPACTSCNFSKGNTTTRRVRKANKVNRAPYSKDKKQSIRTSNTVLGAGSGAIIGSLFGPGGVALGAFIGGAIGSNNSPTK